MPRTTARRVVIEPPVAPVVDGVLDDVDGAGQEVGGEDDGDVLVEGADREGEGVFVPEGPAEDLVAGDPVGGEVPVAGDVGAQPGGRHGLAEVGRLLELAGGPQPEHIAGRDVRSRLVECADEEFVRPGRHDVVAVDEGDVAAVRVAVADPGVAGVPEAAVLLAHQTEPAVLFGEGSGQGGAVVGGPVVDHHHLQVVHGLLREGLQAVRQIELHVVDGDDDTEPWRHVEHVRSSGAWLSVWLNRVNGRGSPVTASNE